MSWVINVAALIRILWPVLVFGTIAYAVFGLEYSGWWFVMAFALCG